MRGRMHHLGLCRLRHRPNIFHCHTGNSGQLQPRQALLGGIVFVCCNLLGWLLYLLPFRHLSLIHTKSTKSQIQQTIAEEPVEVQEELSRNTLEEATSVPGPTSVPEPVPESSPTKEETLIQTQPIELTIAPDLHEKNRANYASREQREGKGASAWSWSIAIITCLALPTKKP